MIVRFHVVAPAAKQRTFTVRLPILLGRGDEAKFRIQHDLVSRRHCELFERHGQVFVRDLGSTNGTFLNDEQVPVSTKTRVPPGGIVRVGSLSFAVEYQRPEAESGGPTVGDQGVHEAVDTVDESRVEGISEPQEGHLDFKVEHADDEHAAAPADEVSPVDASVEPPAQDEGGAADVEESEPAVPDTDAFRLPEPSDEPADAASEAAEQSGGFDFLAADAAAAPAADAVQWPTAEDAAPDDAPDDDQLNAFFKGLK